MFGFSRKPKEQKISTLNSKEMKDLLKQTKSGFERTQSSTRLSSLALEPTKTDTKKTKIHSNPHLQPVGQGT
jgi:hypothetical protein